MRTFSIRQSRRHLITFTLLGAPGSGKGTYGALLAEALQCPLISTSDILRHESQASWSNNQGNLNDTMNTGKLVDDTRVSEIMNKELNQILDKQHNSSTSVLLLDGYPRTVKQLQQMLRFWPEPHVAIQINVPDDICVAKISGRRQCSLCKGNFNITDIHQWHGFTMPPTLPQRSKPPCWNQCKGNYTSFFTVRQDDSDESIVTSRIKLYHEQTIPVMEWYRQQKKLLTFTPYLGKDDFHILEQTVREWLKEENMTNK